MVTGCGGDIGQSIGKILKSHALFDRVIGCDMSDEHAGRFIYDECITIPACTSDKYFPVLEEIIKKHQIDLILPISEPELRFFTENKNVKGVSSKPLVIANSKAREIGFDKLRTVDFLKGSFLPFPETHVIAEMNDPKLPLILKSRKGSGSKSIFILNETDDFLFYKKKYPDFIAQELLTDDNEYTCCAFRSAKGETRIITYRRKLVDSYSGFGVVVNDPLIDLLLLKIADKLDLIGSINIQLRKSYKGPCVFEINPRFSSTVNFRHMMGFQDVIWSVEDILGFKLSDYSKVTAGRKFYKGFHEYIN